MCVVAETHSNKRLARSEARAQDKADSVIDLVQSISGKWTTKQAQILKEYLDAGVQVSHTTPICLLNCPLLDVATYVASAGSPHM